MIFFDFSTPREPLGHFDRLLCKIDEKNRQNIAKKHRLDD
jgi:hypothetical protein